MHTDGEYWKRYSNGFQLEFVIQTATADVSLFWYAIRSGLPTFLDCIVKKINALHCTFIAMCQNNISKEDCNLL